MISNSVTLVELIDNEKMRTDIKNNFLSLFTSTIFSELSESNLSKTKKDSQDRFELIRNIIINSSMLSKDYEATFNLLKMSNDLKTLKSKDEIVIDVLTDYRELFKIYEIAKREIEDNINEYDLSFDQDKTMLVNLNYRFWNVYDRILKNLARYENLK